MLPVFQSYRLHCEAAAAVRLFVEAARDEVASVVFVEVVASGPSHEAPAAGVFRPR